MFGNFAMMVLTILFIFLFGGVGIMPALDSVDSIIESNPDNAYVMLTRMDRSRMSRKEAAKFSVLYSMALDKNYIDIASDSIICTAVKYYRHHGDADYKMRAYYYQGRVRQNANDIDGAMESYVKAEYNGRKSDNFRMRGRVYTGLQTIHTDLFDFKSACDDDHRAAECFLTAGDTSRYINSRLDECTALNALKRYDQEQDILDDLASVQHRMSESQYKRYLIVQLTLDFDSGNETPESIKSQLNQISGLPANLWLSVAYLYVKNGDAEAAKDAIASFAADDSADLSLPFYHLVRSKISEAEHNYPEAFRALRNYVNVTDSVDLRLIRSSAPYAGERYENQLDDLQHQYQIAVLLLMLTVAALVAFLIKSSLDKQRHRVTSLQEERNILESEAREYSKHLEEADREIMQLKRILTENTLSEETRLQVKIRLDILNKFVADHISMGVSNGGQEDIDELLSDKSEFLNSMIASFSFTHPQFVKYLQEVGMTEREIGCCCLYCIGLRGSEIASYIELSDQSYYNFSSRIRKKLGQEGYTSNINTLLKEKLSEYDARL